MNIKDVIAQAEDRFDAQFSIGIGRKWIFTEDEAKEVKDWIFSTYTKDLLQSVVEMAESNKLVSVEAKGVGIEAGVAEAGIWQSAYNQGLEDFKDPLTDIINNISKE